MHFYRIADGRFSPESGDGAGLHGGRWNSPGLAVICACTSYAAAMLEKLVHTSGKMPRHQVCVTFTTPDRIRCAQIDSSKHPGWDQPDCSISRVIGDAWLTKQKTAVLLVPSVVFKVDHNVLINPLHPDFARIRVANTEPVRWDARLFSAANRS